MQIKDVCYALRKLSISILIQSLILVTILSGEVKGCRQGKVHFMLTDFITSRG